MEEDGTEHTGEARSEMGARDAALMAIGHRGALLVFDPDGKLVPWCSICAYAGDAAQG